MCIYSTWSEDEALKVSFSEQQEKKVEVIWELMWAGFLAYLCGEKS